MNRSIALSLLASGLLLATPAAGKSPSGRERNALVMSIDRKSALLAVQVEEESRPRIFAWNNQTDFVQHGRFTGAEVVNPGAAVRIRYHVPFFGQAFVCKITILDRSGSLSTTKLPQATTK